MIYTLNDVYYEDTISLALMKIDTIDISKNLISTGVDTLATNLQGRLTSVTSSTKLSKVHHSLSTKNLISTPDVIIFTSKNAVLSLFSQYNAPKHTKLYAIGQNTAEYLPRVDFVSSCGTADEFATELIPKLQNKKVWYPRAKKISSNIIEILTNNNINIQELIVYENKEQIPKLKTLQPSSIVIFSSPLLVKRFFKYFDWNESLKAISIGKSTSKELSKYISDFKQSKTQSIENCISLAKQLLVK